MPDNDIVYSRRTLQTVRSLNRWEDQSRVALGEGVHGAPMVASPAETCRYFMTAVHVSGPESLAVNPGAVWLLGSANEEQMRM